MKPSDKIHVLIVGAGPTGLMLANQLACHDVSITIIDQRSGPSIETKALGVHARSLEIYAQLGIAGQAISRGQRAIAANMWANSHHSVRIPLGDIGHELSPYPFLLILGQNENEKLLNNLLNNKNIAVQWNTKLTAISQHSDCVHATLQNSGGATQKIHANWLAGCDGAHSSVREFNQIDFPGAPYQHIFFIADTVATGPMIANELNVFLLDDGFQLFFPMHGKDHWRVVGILPPEFSITDKPETIKEKIPSQLNEIEKLEFKTLMPIIKQQISKNLNFEQCNWFSTYRIHHRYAKKFRHQRCFLLGDAAHVHSPVGAQGMNTGLQDAYNLGWKLALVAKEICHEKLLDSYESERQPVAIRLLKTTDTGFSFIIDKSRVSKIFRTRIIAKIAAFAMRFKTARQLAFRTVSQTGIHYRKSALSISSENLPSKAPQPGDRFPWIKLNFENNRINEDIFLKFSHIHFNLILIDQVPINDLPDSLKNLLIVHTVPINRHNLSELKRVSIPVQSYFLVRPDGHIGLAGRTVNSQNLMNYMNNQISINNQHGNNSN